MSKKYFRVLILYTAVTVGINSANKVKQCEEKNIDHDVIDGDKSISLNNLFNDSFSIMNQVRNRNISVDEIPFKDDLSVKFHDIKLTKLPCKANSTLMGYHCVLDKYLEFSIPLGCYDVNGYFELNNTIYPFVISMRNMQATFKTQLDSNNPNHKTSEETDIMIQIIKINGTEPHNEEVTSILNSTIPMIKSQILQQFFKQIKTEDLRLYTSTAKNFCFNSRVNAINQDYLINQTFIDKLHHLTIERVKIKKFRPNFIFRQYDSPNSMGFFLLSSGVGTTISFYDSNENAGEMIPQEYDLTLGSLLIEGEMQPEHHNITVNAGIKLISRDKLITDMLTWLFIRDKLQKAITNHLDSIIRQIYAKK